MNKISCIVLFFALLMPTLQLNAQSTQGARTIFDALQESGAGEGEVIVNQSPDIKRLVGSRLSGDNIERSDTETFIKLQGFRTKVFSGNNQRSSKDEAFAKERQVKEIFPDLPTYVTYTAPFWRLRVGDFRSHEEAYRMLRLLRDAFPSFGKEMYIVREEVKIPLQQY